MNVTIHLTNRCNLSCKYCYVDKKNHQSMNLENAKKAVDMVIKMSQKHAGFVFFGGEPLLMKGLIYQIVDYAKLKGKEKDLELSFKITTNGMLLDKDFLHYSEKEGIFIALSHDGVMDAHDMNRIDRENKGTYQCLLPKIKQLLHYKPYSPVLQVVTPQTAKYFSKSVMHLHDLGFRFIVPSVNFSACWSDAHMKALKKEYEILADYYFEKTLREEKFYFSLFDTKINSYIDLNKKCSESCDLGKSQISIAPDGAIYPCVQFVGDEKYKIGHVDEGINRFKRDDINLQSKEKREPCDGCVLKKRCASACACLNKQITGSPNTVSPVLCSHERVLIPIADRLAEKLYKRRNAMFIQKHYNKMYPVISLVEDEALRR
ncbi:MAG: SPASM domain-containing protein [Clostridia bacterium]|nr:SPASM domain-containing protein [Clostridia bacterium]